MIPGRVRFRVISRPDFPQPLQKNNRGRGNGPNAKKFSSEEFEEESPSKNL
jgi:hypothetical protein